MARWRAPALAALAILAGLASPAPADGDAAQGAGRYALGVLQGAGGGAFVTDTATGDTMFCTPRECRRLAVRPEAPVAAAPRAPAVRRGVPAPPPDFAPPPAAPPPVSGGIHPALENF